MDQAETKDRIRREVEFWDDTLRRTYKTPRGHKNIMSETRSLKRFEGRHLELAILRARRWIKNARNPKDPPRHIGHAMAAFARADPEGFKRAIEERGHVG